MRRILIENIVPGMKLAKTVYSDDGSVLLAQSIELKPYYVDRLKELGVLAIYIEDEISKDIEINDVISERTRLEAVQNVREVMDCCRIGKKVSLSSAKKVVNGIVDEIAAQRNLMINFMDLRTQDNYLFAHSVNVCVLSIAVGIALQYDELKLRDLGVGALLHDVGMSKIPESIAKKPGKLTSEEFAEIKKHPVYGFEMLRSLDGINLLSAHVAFQHHERRDGNGYPRNLAGDTIHEFAQIVAIADVYDAMTSDQVYRKAIPVYEAINILRLSGSTHFNPELVSLFIDSVAIYPMGTIVRLNTQQIGIVIDINPTDKTRPVIRIVFDETRQQLKSFYEVDLSKHRELYIADVFETEKLLDVSEV